MAEGTCRWAELSAGLSDAPQFVDLPVSEQVARGQTLLQMLQGPVAKLQGNAAEGDCDKSDSLQSMPLPPPPRHRMKPEALSTSPALPPGASLQSLAVPALVAGHVSAKAAAVHWSSRNEPIAMATGCLPPPPAELPPPPSKPVPPPPPGFEPRGGAQQRCAAAQAAAAAATEPVDEPPSIEAGGAVASSTLGDERGQPPRRSFAAPRFEAHGGARCLSSGCDDENEDYSDLARLVQASVFDDMEPEGADGEGFAIAGSAAATMAAAGNFAARAGLSRPPGMWPASVAAAQGKTMRAEAAPYVPLGLSGGLAGQALQQHWQVAAYPVGVPAG
mmetsp:Transcript_13366/g.35884  ORF Transcript_13366/g.35884 Transcript_13366/m.35884 type:complete len:332 (+) Transcript_13366:179-1174(+)|eukprot:CAMPEP_0117489548 /NCGR_PEP_ID=MMETSP0784-20121206/17091_1 /TAXON_ID=39447 /ORGANISM="" /LENGTH=331 /DNA_ID=CAMNT_0005284277 /DNA_START=179 /DNA_END=1174 /DNA_ORIENTATION=+